MALNEVNMQSVSDQLRDIADGLSASATWKNVLYEIYVRQEVAAGRAEALQGQFATDDQAIETFAEWGIDIKLEDTSAA